LTTTRETLPTIYQRDRWANHFANLQWQQGEHVLISGPTGSGKTTMVRRLIEKRSHVVVFVSKLYDPTFKNEFKGWTRLEEWPKGGPKPYLNRILLWPRQQKTLRDSVSLQREVFRDAINAISVQGKRCIVIDESLMMNDPRIIGLGTEIGLMHYYGRSSGISMVDLMQRPAWIPNVIYSSVTHAYITKTRDRNDLKRLSDMGGVDNREVGLNLMRLPRRQDYVYLNPLGDAPSSVVNTRK